MSTFLDLDDLVAGQPHAAAELAGLRQDLWEQRLLREYYAARWLEKHLENEGLVADRLRLDWFFSTKPDYAFVTTYMDGMRAGWTLDQWRTAIDRHMTLQGKGSAGHPLT